MGKVNKLLMDYKGNPMLIHTLNQLTPTGVRDIVLVLGHEHEKILDIVPEHEKIRIVLNPEYRKGMSTSMKAGIRAVKKDTDLVMICLGDMPYLQQGDYALILDQITQQFHSSLILQPEYQGQRGHPVCFANKYFRELSEMPDDDNGARRVIKKHLDCLRLLDMPNNHCLQDIDQ